MPTTRDDSPLLRSDVPDFGKDIRHLAASFGQSQEILSRLASRVDALGAPSAPSAPSRAGAPAKAASPQVPPAQAKPKPAPTTPQPERRPAGADAANAKPAPKAPQPSPQTQRPAAPTPAPTPPAAKAAAAPGPRRAAAATTAAAKTGSSSGNRTTSSPTTAHSHPGGQQTIPAFQNARHPLPPAPALNTAPKPDPWWTKEGAVTRVLGIVGGVLTAIGMAFFLAIVFNLVGPFGQLGIAILVGGILGGSGWALQQRHEKKQDLPSPRPHGHRFAPPSTHIGALALLGTSIAVFMLIPVAAAAVYELLPSAVGLLLVFVVAAAGLGLARKLSSAVMAGIGACGAMVSMVIVEHTLLTLAAVAVMFIVSGLLTTHLGVILRIARTLTYLGTATAIIVLLLLDGSEVLESAFVFGPAGYIAVLTATAVCAMLIGARDIEEDRSYEFITGVCALVPTFPVAYYFFDLDVDPNPFFFLVLAAFYIPAGIVIQVRASRFKATTATYGRVTMSFGAILLNLGLLWVSRELEWPAGIACITLSVSAASAFVWHRHHQSPHSLIQASAIGAIPLVWTVSEIANPDLWILPDTPFDAPGLVLVQLAAATAMLVFALSVLARTLPRIFAGRPASATSHWVWSLLSAAWIASTVLYAGLYLTSKSDSEVYFYLGHLVVTIAFFALAIVLLSTKKALPNAKAVGAIAFLASLAKLFFVDLATMSALVRVLVFCLVGGMLLIAATMLSNRTESNPGPAGQGRLDSDRPRQDTKPNAAQGAATHGASTHGASTHGPGPHGTNTHGPDSHGAPSGRPGPQRPRR